MIRRNTVATPGGLGFRRRMGSAVGTAAGAAGLTSSLATAGIGAAVSLAAAGVSDWMNSIQLSHNADTATTLIVNGLEQQLKNLDAAYAAEPVVTCADQRAALDAYDQAWLWLQSSAACGNPTYGSAGNRCISDRAPGGTWPWQTYYRDPIANDPRLSDAGCDSSQEVLLPSLTTGTYAPSGITASGSLDSTTPATSTVPTAVTDTSSLSPLMIVGALVGAVLIGKIL